MRLLETQMCVLFHLLICQLALEYCDSGSLWDIMKKRKSGLTERQIAAVAVQVLHGLEYLHQNRIIHRDIKAANLLCKSNGEVKICEYIPVLLIKNSLGSNCSLTPSM